MSDVQYSRAGLRSLGSDLAHLASDLRCDGALAHVSENDVGHRLVVDALEELADGWDDQREALAASLDRLAELATRTGDTIDVVDVHLAGRARRVVDGGAR